YFKSRAAKGDRAAFRRILDKAGTEEPREGDELPK
ncbi:MAG: toxin-antitoxin system HicB family antitoxin, partial [Blastocatellia bacterium]|nr:toxin-antitoxin system HicB family antitoxin [Blastocatellia bacterium]